MSKPEPFLEYIDLSKDTAARHFHCETAQQKQGSVEIKNGRQQHWVPIADLFVCARIHVGTGLSRKEQRDQDGEKHHVSGEPGKEEEPDFVKQLARSTVLVLPVVVAPTPTPTGRSMVYRRFTADSRL